MKNWFSSADLLFEKRGITKVTNYSLRFLIDFTEFFRETEYKKAKNAKTIKVIFTLGIHGVRRERDNQDETLAYCR